MTKPANTNTTAISLKLLAQDKEHDTGVTRSEIFRVDPDKVTFEKNFNLRTDDEALDAHIERLYQAMRNGASVPPIDLRVDSGAVYVVDGYCRTTAARRVKKDIPEFTLEARNFRGNDQDRVLHMLGTGSGQKSLTPLEQGIGYLRLLKFGMSKGDIATKLGISTQTVDNGLTLAEAPAEVQTLIKDGVVSSTAAREAISQGPEGVEALKAEAKKVIEENAASPTPGKKPAKKKKVTSKKLAGTAAAKGAKAKKSPSKKKYPKKGKSYTIKGVMENEIVVKHTKEDAKAIVDFLKANAPDDNKHINAIIGTLELELM